MAHHHCQPDSRDTLFPRVAPCGHWAPGERSAAAASASSTNDEEDESEKARHDSINLWPLAFMLLIALSDPPRSFIAKSCSGQRLRPSVVLLTRIRVTCLGSLASSCSAPCARSHASCLRGGLDFLALGSQFRRRIWNQHEQCRIIGRSRAPRSQNVLNSCSDTCLKPGIVKLKYCHTDPPMRGGERQARPRHEAQAEAEGAGAALQEGDEAAARGGARRGRFFFLEARW